MLGSLRKNLFPLFTVALSGLMLVSVVRFARSDPPQVPRESDRTAADRLEPAPPGGDLRIEGPAGNWIGGLAVVEPAEPELRLTAGAPGRVAAIEVEEGDFVEAGTLLVALESAAEEAAVAVAEAEVGVARQELSRVRGAVRNAEVEAARRDAEAARARAASAADSAQRVAASADFATTPEERTRVEQQSAEASAAAGAAEARLSALERGTGVEVRLARARVQAAEARLAQAEAALALRHITAPSAGEVLQVRARLGEWVQPGGEATLVLGDTRQLRARVDVDERDLAGLTVGAAVQVTADAAPDARHSGRVVEIGRRMGRKNIRTNEPTERLDAAILEVVVELEGSPPLVVGQRLMAWLERPDAR